MKKILLSFVVLVGVVLLLVVGCSEEKEKNIIETTTSEEATEGKLVTVPEMEPVLIQINSIEEYRETVKQTEKFVQQENEIEFLEENGFKIVGDETIEKDFPGRDKETYYFPIVAITEGEVSIWYTTEYGEVLEDYIHSKGNLHYDSLDDEDIWRIQREKDFTLTYNESKGEIKEWKYGQLVSTLNVPANSYWAGDCAKERHFFRSGSDVYMYQNAFEGTDTYHEATVRKVAYEVAEIIDCNYYYHHDRGMAPLFLMKNGSLKVYYEDKLQNICYEGGYHY